MKKFLIMVAAVLLIGTVPLCFAGDLPRDNKMMAIQTFAPDPAKSENQQITTGNSYTLDTSGFRVVRFYSDQELKVKLNSNTAYFRSYEGFYGIGNDVTQIVFANDSGSTANLDIEGM